MEDFSKIRKDLQDCKTNIEICKVKLLEENRNIELLKKISQKKDDARRTFNQDMKIYIAENVKSIDILKKKIIELRNDVAKWELKNQKIKRTFNDNRQKSIKMQQYIDDYEQLMVNEYNQTIFLINEISRVDWKLKTCYDKLQT